MRIRNAWALFAPVVVYLLPAVVSAQGPIPPIGGTVITLRDVVFLVQRVMNVGIIIATLAIIAMIVYAGFKMATSAGDETAYKKAKTTLYQAIWGALIVFGVGLIVNTIANVAYDPTRALY